MKPKIAFFDFTSCEGCQIELTNMGDEAFLGLIGQVDIVEFREVMKEQWDGELDIAFIEGSFSREQDRRRLEAIRKRSKLVVAYGACAATGGVTALKNHRPDYARAVYGDQASLPHLASQTALPVSAAIKVDYSVHGCPIDKSEFLQIVSHLLHGKEPVIPNHPVCVECKMRETICRFECGDHCLGLVARAGCGAPCPADGIPCEACRGFVDHADLDLLTGVLREKGGLSEQRSREKPLMFTAALPARGKAGLDGGHK